MLLTVAAKKGWNFPRSKQLLLKRMRRSKKLLLDRCEAGPLCACLVVYIMIIISKLSFKMHSAGWPPRGMQLYHDEAAQRKYYKLLSKAYYWTCLICYGQCIYIYILLHYHSVIWKANRKLINVHEHCLVATRHKFVNALLCWLSAGGLGLALDRVQ